MDIKEKASNAISLLNKQILALNEIIKAASRDSYDDTAKEKIKRWKSRTVRIIAENISAVEGEKLEKKRKGSFIAGAFFRNLCDEENMYIGFLQSLIEDLDKYPKDIFELPVKTEETAKIEAPEIPQNNDIFIIHGHDKLNLLRLKELLKDRWKLNPIVLSSKAGKGRTIIEKFEQEAQSASFALALFTADDFVEIDGAKYYQARPNVLFELGWFYGRLARSRVCILFKKGTKIPSDLKGISRIQFTDSIEDVIIKIEEELLGAGILEK